MNSPNNKKLLISALSLITTLSIMVISLFNADISAFKISADGGKKVTSVTETSLKMDNNYSVAISSSGFTAGNLFSLSSDGYIRNTEPIRGITNIEVTYASSSPWAKIIPCYYDYENDVVSPTSEEWPEASTSATFDSPIDYFEIYNSDASNDVVIEGINITYSCSTSTYSFSVSFTPNWNNKTAETHADIYIAGTSELISDGTPSGNWNYKKLTYNAGTYSYTSPNALPTGIYKYSFYASKNGEAINWSNQTTNGNVDLTLVSNTTDNTSYAWDREPGSATTYTLNVIYFETCSGAWATWRGFNYSTSSSNISSGLWGANLTWDSKDSSGVDKYVCSGFEIESTTSTIYIALKIGATNGSSTIDPSYIGASTTTAFAINYTSGATTATLTVNMTLTTVSATYTATSYDVEVEGGSTPGGMSHNNVTMNIYDLDATETSITNGKQLISPTFSSGTDTFTPSFSGNNIRIDNIDGNYYITALKAGTTTNVTLTATSDPNVNCTFKVNVPNSSYSATSTRDNFNNVASSEGWFVSTDVDEISGMGSDFFNGIDISSCKALYLNGSNFYNSNGVEESLFVILKNAGVNWVRFKLWVDPFTESGTPYGGGQADINSVLWMAYEAKATGLNILLDLHYSDWWAHPAQQVLPKAWVGATSASSLATYIKNYTKNTLNTFNSNGCLPDMVQLGNEISSGSFLQLPGADSEAFNSYYEPSYLYNSSNFSYQGTSGSNNMKAYLNAGVEAVNEINSSLGSDIKTVIHWAKGSSISSNVINNWFNALSSVAYDYAAISYYPYYCFSKMSDGASILSGLSIHNVNGNVPWFIAETSYPFSNGAYVYEPGTGAPTAKVTDGMVSTSTTGSTTIYNSYPYTPVGQANMIHDLTSAVVSAGGLGIFYWEAAWIPNAYVGYAGEGSSCTWSNQGFFSFNGKAMANIDLFAQMSPSI